MCCPVLVFPWRAIPATVSASVQQRRRPKREYLIQSSRLWGVGRVPPSCITSGRLGDSSLSTFSHLVVGYSLVAVGSSSSCLSQFVKRKLQACLFLRGCLGGSEEGRVPSSLLGQGWSLEKWWLQSPGRIPWHTPA